ncbi:unnamed protein product [Phytophthora fragariaefolia]|uniref:Unnamed protein product n=1 Tax=Phytophthora fragariaefolia TaxID=1490495 RepID=A0A9W6YB01_9STRA|nr:unnamed protein product [Phytophthora fragariaefolia]
MAARITTSRSSDGMEEPDHQQVVVQSRASELTHAEPPLAIALVTFLFSRHGKQATYGVTRPAFFEKWSPISEISTVTPPVPVNNDEPCQNANVLWCNQNGVPKNAHDYWATTEDLCATMIQHDMNRIYPTLYRLLCALSVTSATPERSKSWGRAANPEVPSPAIQANGCHVASSVAYICACIDSTIVIRIPTYRMHPTISGRIRIHSPSFKREHSGILASIPPTLCAASPSSLHFAVAAAVAAGCLAGLLSLVPVEFVGLCVRFALAWLAQGLVETAAIDQPSDEPRA